MLECKRERKVCWNYKSERSKDREGSGSGERSG